ncbi:esterase [Corynebacterium phocae]|uniref:Esterase n=1 Tax=Corynebacterium phocae TaxID=161895 RepID=A0A1L7D1L2_9CORY|nr:alpha/beta hydrolase family protein [Corynebacterium phocae]APT91953.1 esterase [Corynebacterium phocae]KAA8726942.1 esterase [Corynebacterium phocae]
MVFSSPLKIALALSACLLTTPAVANAQLSSHLPGKVAETLANNPQPWLGNNAFIVEKTHVHANHWRVRVWSPANRAIIENNVLVPENAPGPRPSFYLLPGIEGGQQGLNWLVSTDVKPWFARKNVNVVMPLGGPYSLYTDWSSPDPILGVNRWSTYVGRELPPLIDAAFGGTGVDAVAGLSSTGAAALNIAAHNSARFRAAASYSGCPMQSSPLGATVASAMMSSGGGSSMNAWGLPGGPAWRNNDPASNLHLLRDVEVFTASASGIPGGPDIGSQSLKSAIGPQLVERVSNMCTADFVRSARQAGVRVNHYYSPLGAHTFGLFAHEMKVSWAQTIARTIGARDL